ncbi:hypothetical protein MUP01_14035 [Candidatus Bathyarchaeota archaeon]|nr:hypothetical protein [Candidatus Bathyarchaeota archaeon]
MSKEKTLAKKTAQEIFEDNSAREDKDLLHKIAQRVFEEVTTETMGSNFQAIVISFQLKQKFGKDPYEVLIDDPETFYNGLSEVSGDGADVVLGLVGSLLSKRYGANLSAKEFLELFTRVNGQSKHELKEIFRRIADQPAERERAMQTASDRQWLTNLKASTM